SPQVKVVTVTADWQNVTQLLSPGAPYHLTGSDLSSATTALAPGLAAAGLPAGSGAWGGLTSPPYPVSSGAGPRTNTGMAPQVEVLDRPELTSHAKLTTGSGTGSVPPRDLPCAVSTATAARFGLRPGSRLVLDAPTGPVTLFITSTVAARDPASPFCGTDTAP